MDRGKGDGHVIGIAGLFLEEGVARLQLPKQVLEALGLRAGDQVEVEVTPEGTIVLRPTKPDEGLPGVG